MTGSRIRFVLVGVAVSAFLAVAGLSSSASGKSVPPLNGVMVITALGSSCPGFAPFFPGDSVAGDGTVWFASSESTFAPGEYLWYGSVDENAGGVFRADGPGVPPGYPGWMPTSDHSYKLTGHVIGGSVDGIFDEARMTVVRDDGAKISGDADIQVEMNHGVLQADWTSPPTCRAR